MTIEMFWIAPLLCLFSSCTPTPPSAEVDYAYDAPYLDPYPAPKPVVFDFSMPEPPTYPGCTGWDCREQRVVVTYNLDEQILDATVVVEAFDNALFAGAPVNTARLSPFDAYRPGAMGKVSLWLKTGRYFLRTYLEPQGSEAAAPYAYADMQLVKDRPVGILGALSSPVQLDLVDKSFVDMEKIENVVFISLSHLFRDQDSPYGTNAHLRLTLKYPRCASVPFCADVQAGTQVIVRIAETGDPADAAVAEIKVPIEALMVATHPGQADVLTEELPLGAYAVYAFLDVRPNDGLDADEPRGILGTWDAPAWVKTKKDATPTLSLEIGPAPEL